MKKFVLLIVMFVMFNGIAQIGGRVEFNGSYDKYKVHNNYVDYEAFEPRRSVEGSALNVNFSGIYKFKSNITAGVGLGIDNIISSLGNTNQDLTAFVRLGYDFKSNICAVEVIYGFLTSYEDNYFVKPTINLNISNDFMVSVGYIYRRAELSYNTYVTSNGVNVGISYLIGRK